MPTDINIERYREQAQQLLADLERISTDKSFSQAASINAQYKQTLQIITLAEAAHKLTEQIEQAQSLLQDPDLRTMAEQEVAANQLELDKINITLERLTTPTLANDEKNAILEFRSGTGGTEAALFAEQILHAYIRYAAAAGFSTEEVSISFHAEGGIKEAIILVSGVAAFGHFRFESGVHRVQRVPTTEAAGRIHTSAISITVIPEVPATEVAIDPSEIRIDVYRSSGPGGQSVNTTDSAVRITHLPTGITVSSQDGKSQHKNKDKAMNILASKLAALATEKQAKAVQDIRQQSIQSGDRSAKIRTYNFPQNRITDHRINKSWYNLPQAMQGELAEIVETVNLELRKPHEQA